MKAKTIRAELRKLTNAWLATIKERDSDKVDSAYLIEIIDRMF